MKKVHSKIFGMVYTRKRREGRPRNSWMLEVTTKMKKKEINNMDRQGRMEKEN